MDIASLVIGVDSRQAKDGNSALATMVQTGSKLEGVIKTVATAWASWAIFKQVRDVTQLAARYDTLGVVMGVIGNNAGYSRAQMAGFQTELEKTGISMLAARDSLNMMAAAQLDLGKSAQLARVAQDAAVIGGINSSEAFNRLVVGITSGQTEVLRTMGLLVNFETAYQKAAAKTGRDLSESEKLQVRFNIVLAEGAKRAGAYESAMGTAGKQALSMERYVENLKVQLGATFQEAYAVVIAGMTSALKGASEWVTANSVVIHELGTAIADTIRSMDAFAGMLGEISGGGKTATESVGALTWVFRGLALGISIATDGVKGFVAAGMQNFGFLLEKLGKIVDAVTTLGGLLGNGSFAGWGRDLQATGDRLASQLGRGTATGSTLDRWLDGQQKRPAQMMASHSSPEEQAALDAAKAANAAKQAQDLKDSQMKQMAGQRKEFIKSLQEEAATYGMTKDQILQYNAARLGLSGSQALKDALDLHRVRREEVEDAAQVVDSLNSIRQAQKATFDERQRDLEEEAMAWDRMIQAAYPYLDQARQIFESQDLVNEAFQKGAIPLDAYNRRMKDLRQQELQLKADNGDLWSQMTLQVESFSTRASDAFVDFAFTGKQAFGDLVSSMLRDLARLAIQKNVMGPLFGALGSWMSGSTTTSTTGGSAGGGLNFDEVFSAGPSAPPIQSTVNVTVNQGEGKAASASAGSPDLARQIESAVNAVLVKNMRPNGLLARS